MPAKFSIVERQEIVEKAYQCLRTPEGKPGLDYLLTHRQLHVSTIKDYHLGFIPFDVNHMLCGRVIIPIYDPSGTLVSVSSRRISDVDDGLPVYWHESYDKSYYLFGVPQAIAAMREFRFAIVCEGQFDVLQMHNHGVLNVVGLCSSKLSDIQLSVIYRYCPHVVLLLDRDENGSGQKAMQSILDAFFERGPRAGARAKQSDRENQMIPVYFPDSFTPVSIDPDSFIRQYGVNELKTIVRQRIAVIAK